MSGIHVNLIGGLGNNLFQYAYARAYALENGIALTTNRWIGEEIFDLPSAYGQAGTVLEPHYRQDQASLIYTRKQVKDWFRFKPEVQTRLEELSTPAFAAHRRVGDYSDLGYVVVSRLSYQKGIRKFGYEPGRFCLFTEEAGGNMLEDFYRMMKSEVLFRGNSTFSWWAATLSDAVVYSPVIDGLEGGMEQECEFVEGNHPKFANLPGITDLHLEEG